ncbi:MAG: hypothetical protein J1E01_02770 [Acetatifactor sp.]|nr:hypothetical protein [Acetatifactor sp.]
MGTGNNLRTTIISLLLILCLAGCTAAKDQSELNENNPVDDSSVQSDEKVEDNPVKTDEGEDALDISENMLAFYLVLNSKKPFVSAGEGCQEFYWNEYNWCLLQPVTSFEPGRFIVVDMDRDGEEEIMLYSWPESTQVLDYQDGSVYVYQFVFRGMNNVLPNGVYEGSGGASVWGFYRITEFDHGTFQEETLAYTETYGGDEYYEVEGREVTFREFNEYTEQFKVEPAEVHDFTEELLDEVLLGNLSEVELAVVKNAPVEEMLEQKEPDFTALPPELNEILTEGGAFICANDNQKKLFLEDGVVKGETEDEEYQALYYSIVDMDGDGISEVVLTCDFRTTLILHQTDEGVWGYRFGFDNEVGAIAENGTFAVGYSIYGTKGYGRILSFGENGCETENVDEAEFAGADRVWYYCY